MTSTHMDDELGAGDPAGELPAGGERDEPVVHPACNGLAGVQAGKATLKLNLGK